MKLLLSYQTMCKSHNPSERWSGDTVLCRLIKCDEDYCVKYFIHDQTCHQILTDVYVLLIHSSVLKIPQWHIRSYWKISNMTFQICSQANKDLIFSISLLKTPSKVDGLVFLLQCTFFASMVHVLTHFSDPSCGLLILLPATCFVSFHPSSKACSIVTYIIKLSIAVSHFPLTARLHFLLLIFLLHLSLCHIIVFGGTA